MNVYIQATSDRKNLDVGATLFIGNLDPDVDEKLLYDTFSAFGVIVQTPKIARDPETGNLKGFGFVSFDNFDSSDAAIDAMNNQYLMNKQITVSYALKKDGKGERHGSAAERLLAAQARKNVQLPNRLYADPSTMAMGGAPAPAPPTGGAVPPYNMPMGGAPPAAAATGYPRPPPPPPPMAPGTAAPAPGTFVGQTPPPPPTGYPNYNSWQQKSLFSLANYIVF